MATAASLKFSIESTWDGSGVRKAREDLDKLKRDVAELGNKVTVRVKVEPSMVGFATKVRDGANGITVDVRVDPNLTGFQGRLTAAANAKDFRIRARVDPNFSSTSVSDLQSALDARDFNVRVRLEPRAAGFQARLNALSAANDWHVTVDVRVNQSSLSTLSSLLNNLGSSSSSSSSSVGSLTGSLMKLFTVATLVKAAIASLAFQALTPLIATALQATTVLAGVPAILAGVGLAAGTVAIGLDGMSEAFKGLAISGGDFAMSAGDFQAVLDKELMPAAHDFMWALRDLRWEWELLTATVQTNLFQGLGQQMRELGDIYMPKLKTGFAGLSEELNKGILRFMEKLKDPQYGAAIDNLFANVTKAIGPATDALGDFVLGLVNIASAGSGALPQIADDLARIAENFRKWTENPENAEKIKQWFLDGWDSLKEIGGFIKELVTQTLPKLADWVSAHKDDFDGWADGIEETVNSIQSVVDALQTIKSVTDYLPSNIFANLLGDGIAALPGLIDNIKIAFANLAIIAAQAAANILNAMAGIFDAIPGMGGVADKMRGIANALEKGVIPGLKQTRDGLIAMQAAAAAADIVNAAITSLGDGTKVTAQEVSALKIAMDAESRAMTAAGASAGEVAARRQELVASFEDTARAAGMAEGDIKKFSDMLTAVPKSVAVDVKANTQEFLFSFNDVYTLIGQLDAAQATPKVKADIQAALADFKITEDELANLDLTTASPEVIAIITEALNNLATINNGLDETGNRKPLPQVGIVDNASGPLGGIQGQLDGLKDKNITVTTTYVEYYSNPDNQMSNRYSTGGTNYRGGIAGRWKGGIAPKGLPGHAAGYRLPTSGPGTSVRDGFLGVTSRGMPITKVDAGEWIVNGRSSEKFNSVLNALNQGNGFAAMMMLQRQLGAGGKTSTPGSQSRPSISLSGISGGSLDVNVNVNINGNASAETLRAAGNELAPQLVMAIKQGVGMRAKVAK